MARRRRMAVALLVPPPESIEIDGIRRALGDRQLGRIDPHATLIPPINLTDDAVADALAVVDAAASTHPPLLLQLGPITTFGPDSPVRYLAVQPVDAVTDLAEACRRGALHRPRRRPFVPHVTVDIDGSPTDDSADPALDALAHYQAEVLIDRVTVLEHHHGDAGTRWEPYLSYRLTG